MELQSDQLSNPVLVIEQPASAVLKDSSGTGRVVQPKSVDISAETVGTARQMPEFVGTMEAMEIVGDGYAFPYAYPFPVNHVNHRPRPCIQYANL